ncbi:MAG: CDP-alcohol phosphatidyltransferase family protein, partial [Sphingomonas sp.]
MAPGAAVRMGEGLGMTNGGSPAASAGGTAVPQRPVEMQDPLNRYFYHPLARKLARALAPTGVSPNMVSVAGGLLVVAAALAYTLLAYPLSVMVGLGLHLSWHVVDGADGDLARMTGRTSPTGELVDGVCDYAGHVFLYIALCFVLDDTLGGWAWGMAALAGASHIAQTNHAESQKRTYLWWAYGVPWLKQAQAKGDQVFARHDWFTTIFGWMAREYLKLADVMNRDARKVDAALAAGAGDPAVTERMRAVV